MWPSPSNSDHQDDYIFSTKNHDPPPKTRNVRPSGLFGFALQKQKTIIFTKREKNTYFLHGPTPSTTTTKRTHRLVPASTARASTPEETDFHTPWTWRFKRQQTFRIHDPHVNRKTRHCRDRNNWKKNLPILCGKKKTSGS